jgi:HEAT repeat protein
VKIWQTLLLTALIAAGIPGVRLAAREQTAPEDTEPALAVKRLWSPDKAVREAAEQELIHLGPRAITPLLGALEFVANHIDRLTLVLQDAEPQEAERLNADAAAMQWLPDDVCGLLGRLRAEAAIPLLIRIMEERWENDLMDKWSPERQALVEIGAPPVPAIIESTITADATHDRLKHRDPNQVPGFTIQLRAAKVLERIGDARALPVLESLLADNRMAENEYFLGQIGYYVEMIEKKTNLPHTVAH